MQVEERDSGTESDDEAERTDPGELASSSTRSHRPGANSLVVVVSGAVGRASRPALALHISAGTTLGFESKISRC